jgi:hypothetical protein
MAAKGVGRIGGKGDKAAVTHDLRRLLDQAGLGLFGMKGKKLGHDSE